MANYANLKATINANIKANGNEEITGPILNTVLNQAVTTLGAGYQYMGVATPATSPGTPDANVFYIAATPGTYTNFGGKVVADGEVAILKYNGSWTKEVSGAATAAQVTQLGQEVNGESPTSVIPPTRDGSKGNPSNAYAVVWIDIPCAGYNEIRFRINKPFAATGNVYTFCYSLPNGTYRDAVADDISKGFYQDSLDKWMTLSCEGLSVFSIQIYETSLPFNYPSSVTAARVTSFASGQGLEYYLYKTDSLKNQVEELSGKVDDIDLEVNGIVDSFTIAPGAYTRAYLSNYGLTGGITIEVKNTGSAGLGVGEYNEGESTSYNYTTVPAYSTKSITLNENTAILKMDAAANETAIITFVSGIEVEIQGIEEQIQEVAEDTENIEKSLRYGTLSGNGNTYVSTHIYGLLPGKTYCLRVSNWSWTGVTSTGYCFEVVNFIGDAFTRLYELIGVKNPIPNCVFFTIPETSSFIRIGGRVASGTTAQWEFDEVEEGVPHEVGSYIGQPISLNKYGMRSLFSLTDFGTLANAMSSQGFDLKDNILYQLGSSNGVNSVVVADIGKKTILGQFLFSDTTYHMNNVNVGAKYASGDTYPVLFISQCYGDHKCAVIRLNNDLSGYTLIQEIAYNGTAHFAGSNAYDWAIDTLRGFIYAVGNSPSDGRLEIVRFALPAVNGTNVTFGDSDVLDSFVLTDAPSIYQGSRMIGGRMFMPFGFGTTAAPAIICVIDMDAHEIVSRIPLSGVGEVEACAPCDDGLMINNNSSNPQYRKLYF